MKALKKIGIVVIILAALVYFVGMPYAKSQTKKHSPEKTEVYKENGMDLEVRHCSPSKKERVIFGELVPFDKVWRTGANEPTTFSTATDISVMGKKLPAGKYSLWTLPRADKWDVIFNSNIPEWGVTLSSGGAETTRVAESDVLTVTVPVGGLAASQEMFTIKFENSGSLNMVFAWDMTKIAVPISK